MGNTGRPSHGCQNCRKAHVKCDQTLPACARCVRRGQDCEYPNHLDISFRDETKAIQTGLDRRRRQSRQVTPQDSLKSLSTLTSTPSRTPSPSTNIPHGVTPSQFALAVWFSRHGGTHPSETNPHSFMEYLPQFYASASPNSALERATCAMALFTCQHILDSKAQPFASPYFQLGRTVLGDALRMANHAIQDPDACRADDTLMAVMVLNTIDNLLCMAERRKPSMAHMAGASQLIALRGERNFKTPASRCMLAGMHSETVGKALNQGVVVQQVPGVFGSGDWVDNLNQYPNFEAAPLNYLAEKVANIRALVKAILDCPSVVDETQAGALVVSILTIDQKLIDWESGLPETWHPRPAHDLSAATLATFHAYSSTMSVYSSVWIANTYNSFRMLRILLQLLAHEITSHFPLTRTALPCGPSAHFPKIQRLIDEICTSVPFFMGTRARGIDLAHITFPTAGFTPSSADRKLALRIGAWFLCAPLNVCLRYKAIKPAQRAWIEGQMERINSFYDLQVRSIPDLFPGWQINLMGKDFGMGGAKPGGRLTLRAHSEPFEAGNAVEVGTGT